MNETYKAAFKGYERYFEELRNLEAQTNTDLVESSMKRIEQLVDWFESNTAGANETVVGPSTYAWGTGQLLFGSFLMYNGFISGHIPTSALGTAFSIFGLYDLVKAYKNNHPEELYIPETTPEQQRHMYAQFMLQSINARIES